ncbi:hypothetical protein CROQUDRAFT_713070 [Cronartium quercuum f. sp. fusiforme G11]|uniref:Elongation of fatty acids protein n=1 Tax=Cronartium quercuum f. sp. fusiforme G11 TaxID=708437 RepID=A0A9P6NX24_9BASI|nr:hypothetical protein CROQUDRAFT_713070 [Cronartium quercuum f. sp. fusiforme G11]
MDVSNVHQNFTGLGLTSSSFDSSNNSHQNFFRAVANHPYPKVPIGIPINQNLFESTIRAEVPLVIVFGYLILIGLLNKRQDGKNRMKGNGWKAALVFHNLSLAVYSFWTFKGTGPATFQYFFRGYQTAGLSGLIHTFCDSSMQLWDHHLGFYSYWFYLSKFWEILDSLILIGKGRQASLLQEYHHAGAILTVWSGARYESPAAWLFVVFNSLVHTIMYTYYAISVLHLPFPNFLKRALTKIQITQFVVGGSLGALTFLLSLPKIEDQFKFDWKPLSILEARERLGEGYQEKHCLPTPGQKMTVLGGVGYLIPLTGLFVSFYIRSYQRKHKLDSLVQENQKKVLKKD